MSDMIKKIISGGQTGADTGALRAAKRLGLQTGGWAPREYRTENGPAPTLGTIYGLSEHTSSRYPLRTQSNILAADATLVFGHQGSPGTALTLHYARQFAKPYFQVFWSHDTHELAQTPDENFLQFLHTNAVRVLNVAGNRESRNIGIAYATECFLVVNLQYLLAKTAA